LIHFYKSISDEREERVKHSSRLLPGQPVRRQKLKIFGKYFGFC